MESLRPLLFRRGLPTLLPSKTTTTVRTFTSTTSLPKATTARMKRHLNIAPHTSFLAEYNQGTEQIIFNPPSSAPSVYNTPFKFLPKSDPRRRAALASHLFADPTNPIPRPSDIANAVASASQSSTTFSASPRSPAVVSRGSSTSGSELTREELANKKDELPPAVRKEELLTPKHHLTPQDVDEIRRLRLLNPDRWSVMKLAKKFNCAETFVMACVQAPDEHQKRLREKAAQLKQRWGPIKRRAREERIKRKKLLMAGKI